MLTTYLGSADLKRDFLAQIAWHEEQDALIKGTYGEMNGAFRGCAIGCSLHSLNILQGKTGDARLWQTGNHARYEAELGLPVWLAYLEDHVFENLPADLARTWPRRFADAIPVGATVDDRFLAKVLHWSLASDTFGVRLVTEDVDVRGHIDAIVALFSAESQGTATADQREAAARAARDAWDAWDARAARAAWAARDAWDAWAARAARAARAAWAAWDAWDAWDARAAWAARDAWDAWDAAQPSAAPKKAPLYFPALSEFVLAELRALPVPAPA